jgi:hypothetical protein
VSEFPQGSAMSQRRNWEFWHGFLVKSTESFFCLPNSCDFLGFLDENIACCSAVNGFFVTFLLELVLLLHIFKVLVFVLQIMPEFPGNFYEIS